MKESRWNVKTVGFIVLTVLVVVLFIQNAQPVTVKFFLWEMSMSGTIMFPLFVLAGFIMGYVMCLIRRKKH